MGQRNPAFLLGKATTVLKDSSDDDSPMPSWMANHDSPFKPILQSLPSDSDDSNEKVALSPLKLLPPSSLQKEQPGTTAAKKRDTTTTTENTKADGGGKHSLSMPSKQSKPAQKRETQNALQRFKPTEHEGNDVPGPKQKSATTQDAAAAGKAPGPSKTSKRGGAATVPGPTGFALIPEPSASIPVVLPERLSNLKLLMELESSASAAVHGATDLSGDSGAIGRFMVARGSGGGRQVQVDLKGVLYNATLVPSSGTMAIVNIGQTEAKIEALFSEYAQLREDTRFADAMGDAAMAMLSDGEDEDPAGQVAERGEEGPGNGKNVSGGKKGAGTGKGRGGGAAGGKRALGGTRKPRGGGVKKAAVGRKNSKSNTTRKK
jgi:hypothetical protein